MSIKKTKNETKPVNMKEQRYFMEKRPFIQHHRETQVGPTLLVSVLSVEQTSSQCFLLPLKMLPRENLYPHRSRLQRRFCGNESLCIPATHRFPLLEKGDTNDNKIQIRWPGASRWLFYRQTRFQEDTG